MMAPMDRSRETIGSFVAVDEPVWEPPPWPDECPVPGIYHDIPYEEYRAWPAVNVSALKYGYTISAKHMRAALDGLFDADTRARKFGRALHARLLEPEAYRTRFLLAGTCEQTLKSGPCKGKPCGKAAGFYDGERWYCGVHQKQHEGADEPEEYISQQEAENIECIVAAVMSHPVIKLLRSHGGSEVSLMWERDGLPAKARLDKFITGSSCPETILDLKKCRVAKIDDHSLRSSIRQYGWSAQAAWYCDGVERITGKRPLFAFIFMEDSVPYDVRPCWASTAMLEIGRMQCERGWNVYKHCVQTGHWPGICEDIEELDPDAWELKAYGITVK